MRDVRRPRPKSEVVRGFKWGCGFLIAFSLLFGCCLTLYVVGTLYEKAQIRKIEEDRYLGR